VERVLKAIVEETNLALSLAKKAAEFAVELLCGTSSEILLQDMIGMKDDEGGKNFWNGNIQFIKVCYPLLSEQTKRAMTLNQIYSAT
jgi:hypothetical protein